MSQSAILQKSCAAFQIANPQAAIGLGQERRDHLRKQALALQRLEAFEPHTVEPVQAAFGSDPQITIGSLRQISDVRGNTLTDAPTRVIQTAERGYLRGWLRGPA
jgi:hypothetical protein